MAGMPLLALVLLAGAEQAPVPGPAHQPPAQQSSGQNTKTESPKQPLPIVQSHEARTAEDRLADYTLVLTWLTAGLFVANALLWWTTRETLSHLRREFEAAHRPWIPASIQLASDWTWTPEGEGRVTLRFALRNIGGSPATNVDVRTEMFPLGWGFPDPAAAQKKLAKAEQTGPIGPGEGMGMTIFPGDAPRYLDISMPMSAADLERHRQAFKEKFPEASIASSFTAVIVGTIAYRFSGVKHQTGFILELQRIDPAHPNARFALDHAQGNIPIGRLNLSDFWVGSAVID